MNALRILSALILASGLGACVHPEAATRNAPAPQLQIASASAAGAAAAGPKVLAARYDVEGVTVVVPRSLRVSEANSYLPNADIVWRGDPLGDRYQQVSAIVTEAAQRATVAMTKGPKANVTVEVVYFHCLTEKTRYSIGGKHNLHYKLTVTDAATGAILDGPRLVPAEVRAAGGAEALAEDAAGRTQKVVVTEFLAASLRRELSGEVPLRPGDQLVSRADGSVMIVAGN